jgi:ribulose 1,5-bisphosphate synthetase/thiazole synthase
MIGIVGEGISRLTLAYSLWQRDISIFIWNEKPKQKKIRLK